MAYRFWQVFVHEKDPSTHYEQGKFLSFCVDDLYKVRRIREEWQAEGMFVEYYENSTASLMGAQ
jgi:hypothetical protein